MPVRDNMNVIEITKPGEPEVLVIANRVVSQPGSTQILIEVAAAGINRPDCLQRQGLYPPPKGASDIPGLEVAGWVVQVGSEVTRFGVGEPVMALVTGGGYSEYVAADEGCALLIPKDISMIEAAAMPETFFTVWHNVFQRGRLVAGESLLIHGGSSGIGTTAIQLAKNFGAKVIVTAGSAQKCDACIKLGADRAINYREEDFVEVVDNFTDGKGVNVILDMVGGDYIERNYRAASMDGRIVQIAFLQGAKTNVNYMPLMLKRLTHTGSTLRARSVEFKTKIARELEAKVWPLVARGKIKPEIDQVFALKDASEAHRRMEESGHIGKIILHVKN